MTAPRTCRSCGASLPSSVRWCLRCYTPVRELTPRPRQLPPLAHAEEPPEHVRRSPLRDPDAVPPTYSRWRAGPTTFGPFGRILITLVVLAGFPWDAIFTFNPLRLWVLMGYTIAATWVLRHTWRRERVMVEPDPRRAAWRARLREGAPALVRPVDARLLILVVGALALGAAAFAFVHADAVGRYGLAVVVILAAFAAFVAWMNGF